MTKLIKATCKQCGYSKEVVVSEEDDIESVKRWLKIAHTVNGCIAKLNYTVKEVEIVL